MYIARTWIFVVSCVGMLYDKGEKIAVRRERWKMFKARMKEEKQRRYKKKQWEKKSG